MALLASLAGGLMLSWARAGPAAGGHPALPDLRSIVPPDQLSLRPTDAGRVLRFEHVIHNAGPGPLEVRPVYDTGSGTAAGWQRLYAQGRGGLRLDREIRAPGVFGFHPPHDHWHFPFAEHALHLVAPDGGPGPRAAPSHKVGYCLGDTFVVAPTAHTPPPESPSLYLRRTCADPRAVRGISPGWGDQYTADLEGQAVDVEGLPDGEYWFVSTVDPGGAFAEADETNNRTMLRIRLTRAGVTVVGPPVTPAG